MNGPLALNWFHLLTDGPEMIFVHVNTKEYNNTPQVDPFRKKAS